MKNSKENKTFYIIDGNSYIYRAFYAIRGLSTSSGMPTNAVFGFANMLMKVIREKEPDFVAVAFDPRGPTRRHIQFKEYKAHRPPMPKDLIPQIPYIHRLVQAFRIPVFVVEGQEADDVIATLTRRASESSINVVIVTGDKDIMQLIGPGVTVYDSLKEKIFGPAEVEERFGVPPNRVVEILGLMGDASDNIPGVPGIGEKTAQALIRQYGTIDTLLSHINEISRPKLKQSLIEHGNIARLSRDLAVLHADVPLDIDFKKLSISEPDTPALLSLFKEMEFASLLKYVTPEPTKSSVSYVTVLTESMLGELVEMLSKAQAISVDTETTSLDPMRAELVGISFAVEPYKAFYIPLRHKYEGAPAQIPIETALTMLKPVLENKDIQKIGQNLKYDLLVLRRTGLALDGISFDTMIASYLLNPAKTSHSLDALALEYLNERTITYTEVTGAGKNQKSFCEVDIETAAKYSAEDADVALRLKNVLEPKLHEHGLENLFKNVEMKLMAVLADMEEAGVKIDSYFLKKMSIRLEKEISQIVKIIYELAGTEFNINSSKQLADVLFNKLGLTPVKRTKTGFSTDVDVLEELARIHPLPAEILRYRTMSKLKSTYIDALPSMINPDTGRLHTSLNQTVTATGRLSSSEPNLQNIPVRTDIGREIRRAFIAEPDWLLISADYSQIELRILAHLSGDPALIETFARNEDIHTRTASEIFGLPQEEISSEMRRKAKAVNFGIIYGISAFGLAKNIGVSNTEAKRYIENYFARYPGVRAFIDKTIDQAKSVGYVTTLLGRKRHIPELSSETLSVRNFGERMAVNTPIQGTAADLIKLAMINIHNTLKKENMKSRMILQVHDELLFEAPNSEVEAMKKLVREKMEGVLILRVPIVVDIGVGKNWDEAH